MKLLDYNYESVMRGTFGSKRKQEWEQYKMYETQRLNQYPIKDFDPDILKITDKIEKDGYVILKNAFDTSLLDKLKEEVNYKMENGIDLKQMGGALVGKQKDVQDKCLWNTINQPLINTKTTFDIFTHDILVTIAAHYFKCLPALGTLNLRRSFANNLKETHTLLFHQDPNSPNFLKAFLYLNDVDKNGGPFCIVKGSHKNKPQNAYTSKYNWDEKEVESLYGKDSVKYLTANYGDIILANTNAFHRGTKTISNHRTMLTLDYGVHPEMFKNPTTFMKQQDIDSLPDWKKPICNYFQKI